jgi:hypothetical protein
MNAMKTAKTLGYFSIGLGLAQLLAPRLFTRSLGTQDRTGLVRSAYGLRELAAGTGILTARYNPAPFLWARVAGDAVDLVTLGTAFTRTNPKRYNVGLALAAVLGITALDFASARKLTPG